MANMNFGVNILPKANNTYTLGNSDYKWNIFANTLNGISLTNIITDILVDGTSIISNNIANLPLASTTDFGLVKIGNGLLINSNTNRINVSAASSSKIKAGADYNYPIVPVRLHEAVFYGLARAAGDSTLSASSNAVGTYTDGAKTAIQNMLGIPHSNATTSTSGLMSATDKIKLNNVNPNAISVVAFGAVGDGTTDDSVAIQAAFDSGAYDIYFESNKTYYLAYNVAIHRDIKLHGGENTYIKTVSPANGTANNGISITGTLKKTTTLTSDYISNGTNQDNCDNRFTLTDMTDIAIGDILEIEATDLYYSYARSYYHLGGTVIITNIYNGHLFTCDKLPFDITNTENVTVKVYSAPQAVIENLHFISDLNSVNSYTYLLRLAHCKNTTIKDCTFKQMLNGMIIEKCVNTKLDNIRLQESKYNNSDNRDGYGIIIDSSTNTIIERILATCAQHAISISGKLPSINTYIRNCNLTAECRAPGLDTHETVYNLVIENSVLGGAALNGTVIMNNCKIINNRRVSDGVTGITIYGSHNPAFSKIRITNTDFTNSAVTLYHITAQNPVQSFDNVFDSIEIENCLNGRLNIIPDVTATVLSNTINKLSLINWKDCYEIYYVDVCKIKTFIVHDCNFTSSFITDHAGHRYMTNIEYMDYVKTNPVQHKIIINRDTKGEHLLLPYGIPITVSSSDSSAKYIVCGLNLVSDDIQDYLVGTVSGSAGGNISRSVATGDSIPTISMNENKNVVYSLGSGTGKYCVYPIGLYHAVEGGNMIMSTTLINSGTTNGAKFTPYMAIIDDKTGKLIDRYTGTGATATSEGAYIEFSKQVGGNIYILCYYYCSTSVANSITTFSNPVILFSSSLTPNLNIVLPPYTALRRTGDGVIYSLPGINNILCSATNFHVEIKADFISNTLIIPNADTDWSGAMSASDKAKLDGITAGAAVTDVLINSTSILSNGVANIPIATANDSSGYRLILINSSNGILIASDNCLSIIRALESDAKAGSNAYRVCVPYWEHCYTFYGLAKAAGDSTLAASSNAVGAYTDDAKTAIQKMLGIYSAPWEVINEEEFTNAEEADYTITTDSNGDPFELTDIRMLFELPKLSTGDVASSKGSYGQIWFYFGTNDCLVAEPGAFNRAVGDAGKGCWYFIEYKDNMVTTTFSKATTTTNANSICVRYNSTLGGASADNNMGIKVISNFKINKIVIKSVTGNGRYKLYGKRKWT